MLLKLRDVLFCKKNGANVLNRGGLQANDSQFRNKDSFESNGLNRNVPRLGLEPATYLTTRRQVHYLASRYQ